MGGGQTYAMSSLGNQVTKSEHFRLTPHHCFQTEEQVSNFKYQIQSYNYGIGSKLTLSNSSSFSSIIVRQPPLKKTIGP